MINDYVHKNRIDIVQDNILLGKWKKRYAIYSQEMHVVFSRYVGE